MTLRANGGAPQWTSVPWSGPRPPQTDTTRVHAGRLDDLVGQLRRAVSGQLQAYRPAGDGPLTGAERERLVERLLRQALDSHAQAALAAGAQPLDVGSEAAVAQAVRDGLLGLGGLQPHVDDPDVDNIDVSGCDNVWVQYTDGRRAQVAPVAASDAELEDLVRMIAAHAGADERRFDRGSPSVSVRLPDGSRMFAVMAVAGRPSVSIRRHRLMRVTLDDLARVHKTLSPAIAALLDACVRAKLNIVGAGGTNTGKTTLLRALSAAIPAYERLITVEDAYELGLDHDPAHPNCVALQSRAANVEGAGAVELADLVTWALRMNPDRVIVGEVRGAEVIPMCNAMSQGNDGSLATVHASSSAQVFSRLSTYAAQGHPPLLFEASAMLLAGAIDLVVHLDWTPQGRRVVSSIREVTGFDGQQVVSNEIFRPGPDKRALPAVPLRPQTLDRLRAVAFDPALLDDGRWPR